jgi:tetratricopeptide (TPR) repeat protein
MKLPRINSGIWIAMGAMMVASLSLPMVLRAQGASSNVETSNTLTIQDANQTQDALMEKSLDDPKAVQAYDKFHKASDLDKKIKLGNEFLNRYPHSRFDETVYEELAQAYFAKHDLANFYSIADQGIARFPNEPTLLAVTGTTMARAYSHDDPDAGKKLAKAEGYDKQAVELLKTFKRPISMTADQFEAYKKQVSTTAHSGLGLIYFRKGNFADSLKEMLLATQDATTPDATDYLVLGADYQNLGQFKEAADAFSRCAKIPGPMQAGCKQYADQDSKQSAQGK